MNRGEFSSRFSASCRAAMPHGTSTVIARVGFVARCAMRAARPGVAASRVRRELDYCNFHDKLCQRRSVRFTERRVLCRRLLLAMAGVAVVLLQPPHVDAAPPPAASCLRLR